MNLLSDSRCRKTPSPTTHEAKAICRDYRSEADGNRKFLGNYRHFGRFWVQWKLSRPDPFSLVKPGRVQKAEYQCGLHRALSSLGNYRAQRCEHDIRVTGWPWVQEVDLMAPSLGNLLLSTCSSIPSSSGSVS